MTVFLCVGNMLLRILFTALEKALLLPRWQRMDYQSTLSMHYSIIPDWMLNQYGTHPATVSPTAAFVMLDVGPSISHCFASCMEMWAVATYSKYKCLHDMAWCTGQVNVWLLLTAFFALTLCPCLLWKSMAATVETCL